MEVTDWNQDNFAAKNVVGMVVQWNDPQRVCVCYEAADIIHFDNMWSSIYVSNSIVIELPSEATHEEKRMYLD
jgi:hypothetical protein